MSDAIKGWVMVPFIGTLVKANHPITVLNPTKIFEVEEIKVEGFGMYARGDKTCWFNVNMLSEPSFEEKMEYLGVQPSK